MIKRFFILLAFLVVTACTAVNNSVVTPTITPLPETAIVITQPAFTPTASNTSTVLPDVMSYQCLDIADHPPSGNVSQGTIVFNNKDNTDAFLWNNDTKNVYRFPREEGDRLLEFEVSPDRKYIVYRHSTESNAKTVVATADGKTVWSKITDPFSWNWFDNERLIGLVAPENVTPSLFLLNPFTGQRQELRVDYPDSRLFLNDPSDHWGFRSGGLPIYDPTLTRVLYPECDSQCQDRLIRGDGGWPIALWDIEKGQVIARITTMDSYGDTPVWTSDGRQFIVAANIDPRFRNSFAKEFVAMSREGQLRQLTHFMDDYEEVEIPDSYSLSPDGKLVAFWIIAKPSQYEGARLAVLNTETGEITNYCIQSDGFVAPIWSPDGTQLLIVTQTAQDQNIQRAVLVDLVRNYAAQIADADYVKPVGWMASP